MTTIVEPTSSRLNWLRAGVLGANDGIVSIAAIVAGVAGAAVSSNALLMAAIAGLAGGALSMAIGEYVSVSSQRDAEIAMINRGSHPELKEGQEQETVNPWHAALASFLAFLAGGIVPFSTALIPCSPTVRVMITFIAVILALITTGIISSKLGASSPKRAITRNCLGGGAAMIITFLIGTIAGSI